MKQKVLPKYGGTVSGGFTQILPKTDLLSTAGADYPQFTPSYPQFRPLQGNLSSLNMEATPMKKFPDRWRPLFRRTGSRFHPDNDPNLKHVVRNHFLVNLIAHKHFAKA
jgi:hypothetical protein